MKRIKSKKAVALMLSSVLAVSLLAGCNKPGDTAKTTAVEEVRDQQTTPLVVTTGALTQKFSPFHGTTAYDIQVSDLTQIGLITTDRSGAVVYDAGEPNGGKAEYATKTYEYKGAASAKVTVAADKSSTEYLFTLRPGVKFSDGKPVTVDDVLFSYYVYCDPSYSGSSTVKSVDIKGLRDYITQTNPEVREKYQKMYEAAQSAPEATTIEGMTEEQLKFVRTETEKRWREMVGFIVKDMVSEYGEDKDTVKQVLNMTVEEFKAREDLNVAFAMASYGFGEIKDGVLTGKDEKVFNLNNKQVPTLDDFYACTYTSYKGDCKEFYKVEKSKSCTQEIYGTIEDEFLRGFGAKDAAMAGAKVDHISGIEKVGDDKIKITINGINAAAIYTIGVAISPKDYYGDGKFDASKNYWGHEFNNLKPIEAKMNHPMGAGPYAFEKYENKTVYMVANDHYFKGRPYIKYLQLKETGENDKVSGIETGTCDVADPSYTNAVIAQIKKVNGNENVVGDKIDTKAVKNRGYGYVGLNAATMNVGGEPDSKASKDLRAGIATIMSSYRNYAVTDYYGDRATVIEYPISDTSWAAPKPSDQGYEVAFSKNVAGEPIFKEGMNDEQKSAAAIEAAVGFFKAAGYQYDEATKKFTAAPSGAKMDYEVIVGGEGKGNHPSFKLLMKTKEAMASIGLTLTINDPSDQTVLWAKLDGGTAEMWCAAWQTTPDPDMYQIYHSSNVTGNTQGTQSNRYMIKDAELDKLIVEARTNLDQNFRKTTYKACLDIIKAWAVEIPVYQRLNVTIFNAQKIDMTTVTPDISTNWSWDAEIENVKLKETPAK